MGKFRNILIPIDFSEASLNALKYGVEVAKVYQSDIFLLNAYRLIDTYENSGKIQVKELKEKLNLAVEDKLKKLLDSYVQPKGVNAYFESQIGFPDDVIESFVNKNKIDIIIMGTTGEDHNSSIFGQTLSSVVNMNIIPVLAIPELVEYHKWEHVMSSLNEGKSSKSIKRISDIVGDKDIYIKEGNIKKDELESILFDVQESVDLLAIDNKDFARIKKSLTLNKKLNKISKPILIAGR